VPIPLRKRNDCRIRTRYQTRFTGRTVGTDARTHDKGRSREGGPAPLDGVAGGDDAVAPGVNGSLRALEDVGFEIVGRAGGFDEIVRIEARQEGHAEQFQIESMVRLWPKSKGLRDRRLREAQLIRTADRTYDPGEIVRV